MSAHREENSTDSLYADRRGRYLLLGGPLAKRKRVSGLTNRSALLIVRIGVRFTDKA